jgi:hypothetical protein
MILLLHSRLIVWINWIFPFVHARLGRKVG